MITLLYFARLRESFGVSSEQVALPEHVATSGQLRDWLRKRGENWEIELDPGKPVRMAVNQVLADESATIVDGDEVALFPPVTGG